MTDLPEQRPDIYRSMPRSVPFIEPSNMEPRNRQAPPHLSPAFAAFMTGLIDYAGLFPPARLPLEDALGAYVDYRCSAYAWMLSRILLPASRLEDMASLIDAGSAAIPEEGITCSMIGHGDYATPDAFFSGILTDIEAIERFRDRHGSRVKPDMLEIRISPVQITHDALFEAVVRLQRAGLRPFLEIAERPDREEKASEIIAWMGAFNSENSACPPVGFKLRCGGIIPEAIPSSERVARVLAACRDRNVPFKATAGLHHPVRGYSRELGAMTHGFVNLFGAGILSRIHGLNQNQIQAVLDEVSPAHFIFSGSAFSWKDLAATQEQIAEARRSAALSFGSCSFDEPREDLEKLGWL